MSTVATVSGTVEMVGGTGATVPRPGSTRGWRLSATTVALLAVLLSLADGFWVVSLHTTVGAVPHASSSPLVRFAGSVLVTVPLYTAAVWASLRLTARWAGRRAEWARLTVAVTLVVGPTAALAAAHAGVLAWWGFGWQMDNIDAQHGNHTIIGACLGSCAAKRATLDAHLRGIGFVAIAAAVTNALLATWALALRGGRLWMPAS